MVIQRQLPGRLPVSRKMHDPDGTDSEVRLAWGSPDRVQGYRLRQASRQVDLARDQFLLVNAADLKEKLVSGLPGKTLGKARRFAKELDEGARLLSSTPRESSERRSPSPKRGSGRITDEECD